jgi:hypothetical protein
MARFSFQKTLENFDLKFRPSIDPKVIPKLSTCRYISSGENVLFARAARSRKDPSNGGTGTESLPVGAKELVRDRGRPGGHPRQGPCGKSARGKLKLLSNPGSYRNSEK